MPYIGKGKNINLNISVMFVPDRRRFGHVDVVSYSKSSHVWMGRGDKGRLGARQGG
jgi:hypothetical protein